MSIAETIKAIEALPDEGQFTHRKYHTQFDWDDTDIGTYADLKALAESHTRLLKAVKSYCVEPAPAYEDSFEGSVLAVADMEVEKAELIAAIAEAEKS